MDNPVPETTISPVVWDRYYIQTEIEIQEDFRAYIARYRNLDKMQVKIFDFRSGRLVHTLDVKDILAPYLEDYQPADKKLDAICYEEKDCLCIFLEERRLRKKSSEQLPVTVLLLDIQSGEIVAELKEDSWTEEDVSGEETGNDLKELLTYNEIPYEEIEWFPTTETLGIQMISRDLPKDARILEQFPELTEQKEETAVINWYIKEQGDWKEQLEQFLPRGEELKIPETTEPSMRVAPLV